MKRILFLIHDLGHGGAEKVLVNLVNNMDPEQFDITVIALFGGGVNEQFLKPHVRLKTIFPRSFPGNSHVMKLFSPKLLHKLCVKEHYDVEVAYLEGPASRIISGCADPGTKTVCWLHCTMKSPEEFAVGFRSVEEAKRCFSRFDRGVFVSKGVMDAFRQYCPLEHMQVLYNTNESDKILELSREPVGDDLFRGGEFSMIGVGKIEEVKGFDRLARIHARLRREGYPVHTYILGRGSREAELRQYLEGEGMTDSFTFLGYQTNPYKYVSKCDLFVCSSHSEGFSTAATEALIVGTPVVTTRVSGMEEMLGEQNEWGIVTENDEESLYTGIKKLLDDPDKLAHYKRQAELRGKAFSTENTVSAVQAALLKL
ncbi:MAG: glycosyltransferase [Ruminococcaceae bacterium]|nr:glycosyltransferase [Oscillospiraceae bacterium]